MPALYTLSFPPSSFRVTWWLVFSLPFPEEEIETRTGMGDTQKEGWGQDSNPVFLRIPLGGPGLSALHMWCECVWSWPLVSPCDE